MYIIHMKFKIPDKGGWSDIRENESFSKILQMAEEMRAEHYNVPIESIDVINSTKPLEGYGSYQGYVVASLRTVK